MIPPGGPMSSTAGWNGAKPRIIFVNRYFFPDISATSQMLTDLTFGLAARDFDVHVICSRQLYDAPTARLAAHGREAGVHVHRVWTSRFGRASLAGRAIDYATFYLFCGARLLRLTRRGDVVVAKTDPPLISIVALWIARIRGASLVNWLQDVFPETATRLGTIRLPRWADAALRALRDSSLRGARMNVVLGSRMRDFVTPRLSSSGQVSVIENWADERAISPRPTAASGLRARLGLGTRFVVGYSGNLGRVHEFDTLLDAAIRLERDPRVAFLMIGGGAGMSRLREAVAARGLRNFVFQPYQPRESLADSLAAADVHLVSLIPRLEGLVVPSKFYGILAAARPVIFVGDPDGELARVIAARGIGAVIDAGDGATLAAHLERYAADPALREAAGGAAHACYRESFTFERALYRWIELLQPV
jgi:glycosyltransferase involved in cell wall biosynthesis